MPKKKTTETQAEQSERFRQTVRDLVDAGELNPTEADDAFERALARAAPTRGKPAVQGGA
jgi:polyhydroxyalkanoate synthesis regulator phasin